MVGKEMALDLMEELQDMVDDLHRIALKGLRSLMPLMKRKEEEEGRVSV
jgi:hypothetical protein